MFKDLTDVQRSLLLSARKEPGKYVEGVAECCYLPLRLLQLCRRL